MTKPSFYIDIFLQPGEVYFGDRETRIRTLLGSCVAITLWHPVLKIGGMCHYLLPDNYQKMNADQLDGRYADEAMMLFMRELTKTKTNSNEYEAKIFGGGYQFPKHNRSRMPVSDKNIQIGLELIRHYGFNLKAKHLGGTGHRNIVFDLWSGHVWMRHVELEHI